MKFYEAMAKSLHESGIKTLYGVMGEANIRLVLEMTSRYGVEYFAAMREDGAVMMAVGAARASGSPRVAVVTHGPAVTNSLTALTEAARGGIPMLLLTGYTPKNNLHHQQRLDIDAIVRPTGAVLWQVRTPDSVAGDIKAALHHAVTRRCAVVLVYPIEFVDQDVQDVVGVALDHDSADAVTLGSSVASANEREVSSDAVDRAVGVIANSLRPLVLAGRGANDPSARRAVLDFAARLGAPVATTLLAKGLFHGEPNDLGLFGEWASARTLDAINRADCLIVFGASLNANTTDNGSLCRGKAVVHVDESAESLGLHHPATAEVIGDAAEVAHEIIALLDLADVQPTRFHEEIEAARGPFEGRTFVDYSSDTAVDMRVFLEFLDGQLKKDRRIVSDGGRFMPTPAQYLEVVDPSRFHMTIAFGSLGLAVGAACGVAAEYRDDDVVVVVGDGGFAMCLAEFSTAVRSKLNLVVVVINDGGYGVEYHHLINMGLDPALSLFEWPRLADVAMSLGGHGVTVRSPADFAEVATLLADRSRRPCLIDVIVDPATPIGVSD